jgi:hypothetical protein
VPEDVVNDPKLVDDAALLTAQERGCGASLAIVVSVIDWCSRSSAHS